MLDGVGVGVGVGVGAGVRIGAGADVDVDVFVDADALAYVDVGVGAGSHGWWTMIATIALYYLRALSVRFGSIAHAHSCRAFVRSFSVSFMSICSPPYTYYTHPPTFYHSRLFRHTHNALPSAVGSTITKTKKKHKAEVHTPFIILIPTNRNPKFYYRFKLHYNIK